MEFEITMKIKVAPDFFYYDSHSEEWHSILEEIVHNAMYDVDDIKVIGIRTEEVAV
tara:strand:- start:2623 stop:2790 length:168 start_codon:yes stop_codon:yes gene_type:complete